MSCGENRIQVARNYDISCNSSNAIPCHRSFQVCVRVRDLLNSKTIPGTCAVQVQVRTGRGGAVCTCILRSKARA